MLILLLVITIAIIIFFEILHVKDSWTDWDLHRIITIPILIIIFITLLIMIGSLVNCRIIDDKIKLYQKQNKDIEEKIEVVVKQYMDYETNTYKELKSDSYITLVNLYPELKSDKMVQQQIDLYTKNNKEITELKEQKINETIYKWWIYFGK